MTDDTSKRFQVRYAPSACGHPGWRVVDTVQGEFMPRVHNHEATAHGRAAMLNTETERHETVRLFEPAPNVIPGQLGL